MEITRQKIRDVGLRLGQADNRVGQAPAPGVACGLPDLPGLLIHDMSAGRLADPADLDLTEYRALLLARHRDTVVINAPRSPAFEQHIAEALSLSAVNVVSLAGAPRCGLARAALGSERLMEDAVATARSAGGFVIRPYQATPDIWKLARRIHAEAGVPVWVSGPPAGLADRVNDKLWFLQCVTDLLGKHAVPRATTASNLKELVVLARRLAGQAGAVVAKLPSSSGGEGVLVLPSALVAALSTEDLVVASEILLRRAGWHDAFPVQIGVWEEPVIKSPSVQLWIPNPHDGPPRLQGIFEQRMDESGKAFAGVERASLPDQLESQIRVEATAIATLFQDLGYFGQCSLDSILVGEDTEDCDIHWIECNGRWGGTSIPMTLIDRLTGDDSRTPFVGSTRRDLKGPVREAGEAYDRLGDLLFRPGMDRGVFLLSPTAFERGRGFDLLAFAGTRASAQELMAEAERLLHAISDRSERHGG